MPAVLWGIGAGWWMPRGPLTGTQVVWSVVLSLAVGGLAGWASRSRWSMLIAPTVFWIAVEVLRLRVDGPSVDAPHASAFGFVTLIAGRGLQGLLSSLPMLLGAAYGAAVARSGGRFRRYVTALVSAGVLVATVALALPASTPPIPGPRSVAELTHVDANGHRLGLMIRGVDTAAPVLLFVPGAPGGSERGGVRRHLAALEQRFVVVTLDRRGGGASYPALDPAATVSPESEVGDIIAVTDQLRRRFGAEKIYLLGHSGGSVLSVLAVQRRPDLFRAYIGTGQGVDVRASDQIFYTDILAWARSTGRTDLARQLVAQGPPPYADVYSYEPIMLHENQAYGDETNAFADLDVPESTLLQKAHTINALLDTWSALYPRMQDVDLRRDAPRLEVPVYLVQGGREMRGLAVIFDQWYGQLQAPVKELTVLESSGHRAIFEEPDRFAAVLDRVLAETSGPPGR
ncbi:putative aminopeptidase ybaC [Actinoplanes friuliensis DSM 7358]|uniref:Putative aminopeptidase ybaC n=1 Tax=Actinoplanes friuliensis DSM 7358 TaxID=1246995 RepID=U5W2W2_9ACTN|nr:putative aminopeptidase ybaC [Actinoplanes friuliensis DSM 7358]